jgi:DNA adenine methylase
MIPITRPVLRYFGGKWRLGAWIVSHFPEHMSYVEPFCGGASVLLQKAPSMIETINDLDGDLINFFRVLREYPDELIRRLELTPYARAELRAAYEPTEDKIEAARRYYVRSWLSYGGQRKQGGGWRFSRSASRGQCVVEDWRNMDHLSAVVERLRMVQIENDNALAVIDRFDTEDTLFYLDPPYVFETRSDRWHQGYKFEMTDEQHRQLGECLQAVRGMVVLSGYECDLYRELYGGWQCMRRRARTLNQGWSEECLWLNDAAVRRVKQKCLFEGELR